MEALEELRKHAQGGKLVTGTNEVMKQLRQNKLAMVFLSSNCPEKVREDAKKQCEAAGCELAELAVPNDELGVLCKKPFSISAVGVLR